MVGLSRCFALETLSLALESRMVYMRPFLRAVGIRTLELMLAWQVL